MFITFFINCIIIIIIFLPPVCTVRLSLFPLIPFLRFLLVCPPSFILCFLSSAHSCLCAVNLLMMCLEFVMVFSVMSIPLDFTSQLEYNSCTDTRRLGPVNWLCDRECQDLLADKSVIQYPCVSLAAHHQHHHTNFSPGWDTSIRRRS